MSNTDLEIETTVAASVSVWNVKITVTASVEVKQYDDGSVTWSVEAVKVGDAEVAIEELFPNNSDLHAFKNMVVSDAKLKLRRFLGEHL